MRDEKKWGKGQGNSSTLVMLRVDRAKYSNHKVNTNHETRSLITKLKRMPTMLLGGGEGGNKGRNQGTMMGVDTTGEIGT